MPKQKVTDEEIVRRYFGNSHGIRHCAGALGVSKIRVSQVILKYKRKHHIR